MFFADKYSPKDIKDAYFHKDIIKLLERLSNDDSVPHTIFYGRKGSGKKTLIYLFLDMLYGKGMIKPIETTYQVTGSGNNTSEVQIMQSNYHIEINPSNTNFDRYLIQDVVKKYVQKAPLIGSKKRFKIVLINNLDNLSYYAQTSLRRTMEKYSDTCRFIMWTRSLSKVIDPLKSRCFCFRVKCPTKKEMFKRVFQISVKENIQYKMKIKDYMRIVNEANGNIKRAMWLLEMVKFGNLRNNYTKAIKEIVALTKECQLNKLSNIKEVIYSIMITNITDERNVIKDLMSSFIKDENISYDAKLKIINIASKAEYNLTRSRRDIIHYDHFIIGLMKILFMKNLKQF